MNATIEKTTYEVLTRKYAGERRWNTSGFTESPAENFTRQVDDPGRVLRAFRSVGSGELSIVVDGPNGAIRKVYSEAEFYA